MICDLIILSDIRLVREGLAEALARDGAYRIAGVAADLEQACRLATKFRPGVILIDASLNQGLLAVPQLQGCVQDAKIIAFALLETEAAVISWARAGIWGYLPRSAPMSTLGEFLRDVVRGEQLCPKEITSGMLRWIARNMPGALGSFHRVETAELTPREAEVRQLLGAGLSNKEIARLLGISPATTKSHVHSILAKLGVRRRAQASFRFLAVAQPASNAPAVPVGHGQPIEADYH